MSATKAAIELAVGFSTGIYTEEALMEMLGDDDLVSSIITIAGGLGAAGLAVSATQAVLDTEIVTDVTDVVDDVIDEVSNGLSDLNPFSW